MKGVRLILGTVFVLLLVLFSAAPLRAQDKFAVFGGYSYFRASAKETGTIPCPGPLCPTTTFTNHPSLNGWEGSFMYKPAKDLAFVADLSGNYGSIKSSLIKENTHRNAYLFGPEVSFPARVSPFVHVLVGAVHESTAGGAGTGGFAFPAHSGNAFAIALGGGIDVKVVPFIWLRLLQVDYMGTHFVTSFQNQQRVSAGLVIHF